MNHANDGMSDKVKGAVNKAKGEAKDQWGNATDNPKLQAEGKWDKAKGEVQHRIGEWKEAREERSGR
ncbi:CsbD family protein [Cohnella nanjingensis]|uniref:CsbD family protein n=1 Tax=Cohnella nanjingensis TaxID=1387779 RepID=A0A7X0RQF2_9BACL|nr:CsbD family protein [Cohnella nanjingensis]MBB6671646.1 CsbD family protein [Cohnella nanjingensis]